MNNSRILNTSHMALWLIAIASSLLGPAKLDADPIAALRDYLKLPRDKRAAILEQDFARVSLAKDQAKQAQQLLWEDHVRMIRKDRAAEMKSRRIELKDGDKALVMPFIYRRFGKKVVGEKVPLVFSMHGGGGAPAHVNDRQWENQKSLYQLKKGIYLVPRAPTNTWNLWHQAHIDVMFSRLIENMLIFEDVDPDKVYIMGYSAGGDGVFQLAPRMADRLAAAAMMAGHPNETSPLGLRNLPFTLHMGGRDAAFQRNQKAAEWKRQLADLREKDPKGYEHWVKIYPASGHWMNRQDAAAIPWMMKYSRQPYPEKIVWKQDDVTHARFYWLALNQDQIKPRSLIVATREGQSIAIQSETVQEVRIRLNDQMVNLDKPIEIRFGEAKVNRKLTRTISVLAKSLAEYGDPEAVYSAEVALSSAES